MTNKKTNILINKSKICVMLFALIALSIIFLVYKNNNSTLEESYLNIKNQCLSSDICKDENIDKINNIFEKIKLLKKVNTCDLYLSEVNNLVLDFIKMENIYNLKISTTDKYSLYVYQIESLDYCVFNKSYILDKTVASSILISNFIRDDIVSETNIFTRYKYDIKKYEYLKHFIISYYNNKKELNSVVK